MAELDDRALTGFHEAGHAVAAVMRGESCLTAVTVTATELHRGRTNMSAHRWDAGFQAWAGPWAQARAQWPHDLSLDGEDDDGCQFDDHLLAAFHLGGQDDRVDLQAWFDEPDQVELSRAMAELGRSYRAETTCVWQMELDRQWFAIRTVAAWLLAGEPVTDERVRALLR